MPEEATKPERVRYENVAPGVARATMSREGGNLLDVHMLYQLDAAYKRAAFDPEVKVFIVAADGEDFCLGHDGVTLFSEDGMDQVTLESGFDRRDNVLGDMAWEAEAFLGLHWRWRNFPKVSIAQVQGKAFAGGLMVAWPCDLIVVSEEAKLADPVTAQGMNGVEMALHMWEIGARRAKEWMFAGSSFTAQEALSVGLVNKVVPLDELASATIELAEHIATRPLSGLTLAKKTINQSLDIAGQANAVQNAFNLHAIGHAAAMREFGAYIDARGIALTNDEWGYPGWTE